MKEKERLKIMSELIAFGLGVVLLSANYCQNKVTTINPMKAYKCMHDTVSCVVDLEKTKFTKQEAIMIQERCLK
jgi:hypothetical protein